MYDWKHKTVARVSDTRLACRPGRRDGSPGVSDGMSSRPRPPSRSPSEIADKFNLIARLLDMLGKRNSYKLRREPCRAYPNIPVPSPGFYRSEGAEGETVSVQRTPAFTRFPPTARR